MTYQISTNFNDVQQKFSLIPAGTFVKVHLTILPGGFGPGGLLTKSTKTGSIYLSIALTILQGKYAKRKIYQLIGIETAKGGTEDTWSANGRAILKSILESARNIQANDKSEQAISLRTLADLNELNGLEFAIKIGIRDEAGYQPKNSVLAVITPGHASYKAVMNPADSNTPSWSGF